MYEYRCRYLTHTCHGARPESLPSPTHNPRTSAHPLICPALPRLQYIRYLTQTKAYSQILGRIVAGQRKNRFVQEG